MLSDRDSQSRRKTERERNPFIRTLPCIQIPPGVSDCSFFSSDREMRTPPFHILSSFLKLSPSRRAFCVCFFLWPNKTFFWKNGRSGGRSPRRKRRLVQGIYAIIVIFLIFILLDLRKNGCSFPAVLIPVE